MFVSVVSKYECLSLAFVPGSSECYDLSRDCCNTVSVLFVGVTKSQL